MHPGAQGRVRSWASRERRYFAEILTLTAFAVTQPILDVFGKSPETFVFWGAHRTDIVLFGAIVAFLPPAALWVMSALAGPLGARVRHGVQLGTLWVLLSLIPMQVLKAVTPLVGLPLTLIAGGVGAALIVVVARVTAVRRWLGYAWPAPIAFLLLFLLASPVAELVRPTRVQARAAQESRAVPVVMVIFDQFPMASLVDPDLRIDQERFPSFGRLAADATWYRNYTVAEAQTEWSVPTILTGRPATDRSKKPLAADFPENLFTLLGGTHTLHVAEHVTRLCPEDLCSSVQVEGRSRPTPEPPPRRDAIGPLVREAVSIWRDVSLPTRVTRDVEAQFSHRSDPVTDQRPEVDVAGQPSSFAGFLQGLGRVREPALHYFHHPVPHFPWRFYPSGVSYAPVDRLIVPGSDPPRWPRNEGIVRLMRLRHLLQTQYADRLLGELLDRLETTGLYDDALVVITSDHGHAFVPGEPPGAPTRGNMEQIYWVPLLIKAPGQTEPIISDANVTSVDLVATIADHLDIRMPWDTGGISMLSPHADRGSVKAIPRRPIPGRPTWPTGNLRIRVTEAMARLRRAAFVPGAEPSDPRWAHYVAGSGADLIGSRVGELSIGAPSPLTASLHDPDPLGDVDPQAGEIRTLLFGTLTGPGSDTHPLVAVAVNGRVAAVAPAFSLGDRIDQFGFLVPDFLLDRGRNDLTLFAIQGGTLHPVTWRPSSTDP